MVLELDLPVLKRKDADGMDIHQRLTDRGFQHVGDNFNRPSGTVLPTHVHENDLGMGLRIMELPRSTMVIPAGPLTGSLIGQNQVGASFGADKQNNIVDSEGEPDRSSQGGIRSRLEERLANADTSPIAAFGPNIGAFISGEGTVQEGVESPERQGIV